MNLNGKTTIDELHSEAQAALRILTALHGILKGKTAADSLLALAPEVTQEAERLYIEALRAFHRAEELFGHARSCQIRAIGSDEAGAAAENTKSVEHAGSAAQQLRQVVSFQQQVSIMCCYPVVEFTPEAIRRAASMSYTV
jgi:hypothetical protein